jgi:hypothetical protein
LKRQQPQAISAGAGSTPVIGGEKTHPIRANRGSPYGPARPIAGTNEPKVDARSSTAKPSPLHRISARLGKAGQELQGPLSSPRGRSFKFCAARSEINLNSGGFQIGSTGSIQWVTALVLPDPFPWRRASLTAAAIRRDGRGVLGNHRFLVQVNCQHQSRRDLKTSAWRSLW